MYLVRVGYQMAHGGENTPHHHDQVIVRVNNTEIGVCMAGGGGGGGGGFIGFYFNVDQIGAWVDLHLGATVCSFIIMFHVLVRVNNTDIDVYGRRGGGGDIYRFSK